MATNDERVNALKKQIGEDKTKEILELAKEMSERADAVLASKEAKKKKPAVEAEEAGEDAADEAGDEKMKELNVALTAVKEQNTQFATVLKEQSEKVAGLETTLKEVNDNLAKANRLIAALYGIQPKSNGFSASTAKETEMEPDPELAKLAAQSSKAAGEKSSDGDWLSGLAGFVITGNKE